MFRITKQSPQRIDIAITGQIDADEMSQALDDLIAQSEAVQDGLMLYTISELALPTLGAFGVEMRRLPKLFGLIGKFRRCAVLSDQTWVRTAAEIEGALIPGLEIKAFDVGETAAAEAWLEAAA